MFDVFVHTETVFILRHIAVASFSLFKKMITGNLFANESETKVSQKERHKK